MLKLNPFALAALFTSFSCLWIAGIFLIYGKNTLHRLWAIFNLTVAGWAILIVFAVSTKNTDRALNLWIFAHMIGIYVPIVFFHCASIFCNLKAKKLIIAAYIYGILHNIVSLFYVTILYQGVTYLFDSMYYIQFNKANFIPSMSLWIYLAIYANYRIFIFSKNSPNKELRKQAQFLLIGGIIGYLGGSSTFLPMLGFSNFYPLTIVIVAFYCLSNTYAIFKHSFFELVVIYKQSIVYSILIAIVFLFYVVTVLVLERFLQDYLGYHSLSTSISVSFIIGLLVVPFKNWIQNYVDNAFLKGTPYQISQENTLMRQELTSADKLRSIAILASSLAHEIKNPITTINTFADYLPSKQNDTAFLNKCRQTLLHETERIDQLLTQLLSFAKPSPPDFELVYPQEIIDEILLLLEHKCAKQNITIIRSYYSKETILTDPNQLKQAFLNILLNAMESMPQKGILTVATSNNDTTFYISIKDSGIGIKPEELKKIFYPFFTNKQNGTGLGLAISQEIIHHHNGKISVKSTPNVGTEFIISIPKHITNHVNDNTL